MESQKIRRVKPSSVFWSICTIIYKRKLWLRGLRESMQQKFLAQKIEFINYIFIYQSINKDVSIFINILISMQAPFCSLCQQSKYNIHKICCSFSICWECLFRVPSSFSCKFCGFPLHEKI